MKHYIIAIFIVFLVALSGCSEHGLFSGYQKEEFPVTRVSESSQKTIQILNESPTKIQHIMGVAFYSDSNKSGNFQVSEVKIGTAKAGLKDIFIPPMGVLNLVVTYSPLNLETSEVEFGGWATYEGDVFEAEAGDKGKGDKSKGAVSFMSDVLDEDDEGGSEDSEELFDVSDFDPIIHRAMLMIAYNEPKDGYIHIELVGGAVPGPHGEDSSVAMGGAGSGECTAGGTTACFRGAFSIDLPGLMSGGAMEVPMSSPVTFMIDGGAVELNMDDFPPVLIVVKGNGPGEPLEGQPIDAVSIILSGAEGSLGVGSFDGRTLSLKDVGFRIRILLGEITEADINPGLAAAVDFNVEGLEMITDEPFDGSKIIFGTDTTLSANPSGNSLFDSFLGGVRIVVKFIGMLELP